jgi:hypothetical protein
MTYATNAIYAQPLFVQGITVNANAATNANNTPANCTSSLGVHTCNMLLAATLYGSVWAWNADTGKVIFSRTGTGGIAGQNDLWYDDCPSPGIPQNGQGGVGSLPFAGIVSTPVIDPGIAIPNTNPTLYGVMFLTSLCRDTGNGSTRWYLHELDLTNDLEEVAGSNSPVQIQGSATNNSNLSFTPSYVLQRSALLEVTNSSASPANVIYIGFSSAVPEASSSYPYNGWLYAYSTTGSQISTTPDFIFATTPTATASGTSGCYYTAPQGSNSYQNQPNWCGHGGGIWMSSRGPAAATINGVTNAFVSVSNGGFQTGGANWGTSVLGFTYSASSGVGTKTTQKKNH